MTDTPSNNETEPKFNHQYNAPQDISAPGSFHEKELFSLAFENANIGMCLVDMQGGVFKANTEMANIFA